MIVYRQNAINLPCTPREESWECFSVFSTFPDGSYTSQCFSQESLDYFINVGTQSGVPNVLCTTQAAYARLKS